MTYISRYDRALLRVPPEHRHWIQPFVEDLAREFKAIEKEQTSSNQIIRVGGGGGGGGSGGGGGGGGGTTITVRSVDLLTQIANAGTVEFDTDDGFSLSNMGSGTARVGTTLNKESHVMLAMSESEVFF